MSDIHKDDEEPAVRPQVIDLDARDVTEEVAQDETPPQVDDHVPPAAPPPPKAKPVRRGNLPWIALALIVGMLAGGWLYRDVLASYFPTDQIKSMQARLTDLEAKTGTLGEQITAVGGTVDAGKQQAAELGATITEATSNAAAAQKSAAALDKRLATAEDALTTAKSDLGTLRAALSTSGPATGTPDSAALAALAQRIDAVEKDLASLKTTPAGGEDKEAAAALSQSVSDIKAKIAAGAPYAAELDRVARMVPAAGGLDLLTAHAAEGLPNAQGLAAELRATIPLLPKPPQSPTSGGSYMDSVWSALGSIVRIRDIGEMDWAGLAEKSAALADTGDLAGAISLIDAAEGTKPVPLSQWRDRAGQRLNLEAALIQASDAVLRQVTALGGGK